jgi:hypothetical protein
MDAPGSGAPSNADVNSVFAFVSSASICVYLRLSFAVDLGF